MTEKAQKDSEMSTRLERAVPSPEKWMQEIADDLDEYGWNHGLIIDSIDRAKEHFNKEINSLTEHLGIANRQVTEELNEIGGLEEQISRLEAEKGVDQEEIAILKAEISHLNNQVEIYRNKALSRTYQRNKMKILRDKRRREAK